jgi:predicted metal-dependent hydrolase
MVAYTIKKSNKTKRVSIRINANREVIVTIPPRVPQYIAKQFVESKQDWIQEKLATIPENIYTEQHYKEHRDRARIIITARVVYWSEVMGLSYNRLSIRHTTTRWGSCSSKRNLNFSYRLMFLEPELMDYVVIHELVHLVEMNHSVRFWHIVAQYCPDYKILRGLLRKV